MMAADHGKSGVFLTGDELRDLTGFVKPSKQIQWLKQEGFEFRIAADGHPRLLRAHVFRLMGVVDSVARRRTTPDFSAMKA